MTREFGICHSSSLAIMFGTNPNLVFAIGAFEGKDGQPKGPDGTQEDIDSLIRERKTTHDPRLFLVVVEGDLDFCLRYRRELKLTDVIIYCAKTELLEQLGVQHIDADWESGMPPIDLDSILFN